MLSSRPSIPILRPYSAARVARNPPMVRGRSASRVAQVELHITLTERQLEVLRRARDRQDPAMPLERYIAYAFAAAAAESTAGTSGTDT